MLLTGEDPAFCSGDDMKEIMLGAEREGTLEKLREVRPRPTPAAVAMAVNGATVGWGMDPLNNTRVRVGDSVAVIGCSGVALRTVMAARLAVPSPSSRVDVVDQRL